MTLWKFLTLERQRSWVTKVQRCHLRERWPGWPQKSSGMNLCLKKSTSGEHSNFSFNWSSLRSCVGSQFKWRGKRTELILCEEVEFIPVKLTFFYLLCCRSFGVVLWELLTGEIPYKDVDSSAIIWGVGSNSLHLPVPSTCPDGFKILMKQTWYFCRPLWPINNRHTHTLCVWFWLFKSTIHPACCWSQGKANPGIGRHFDRSCFTSTSPPPMCWELLRRPTSSLRFVPLDRKRNPVMQLLVQLLNRWVKFIWSAVLSYTRKTPEIIKYPSPYHTWN